MKSTQDGKKSMLEFAEAQDRNAALCGIVVCKVFSFFMILCQSMPKLHGNWAGVSPSHLWHPASWTGEGLSELSDTAEATDCEKYEDRKWELWIQSVSMLLNLKGISNAHRVVPVLRSLPHYLRMVSAQKEVFRADSRDGRLSMWFCHVLPFCIFLSSVFSNDKNLVLQVGDSHDRHLENELSVTRSDSRERNLTWCTEKTHW